MIVLCRASRIGQALDVHEVHWGNVVRGDVSTGRSTSQRHRRREIRRPAHGTVGSGRIYHQAKGWKLQSHGANHLVITRMNRHGVAHTSKLEQTPANVESFMPVCH